MDGSARLRAEAWPWHVLSQVATLIVLVLSWLTGLVPGISLTSSCCLNIGPVAMVGCVAGLVATACRVALIGNPEHHEWTLATRWQHPTKPRAQSKLYQPLPLCGVQHWGEKPGNLLWQLWQIVLSKIFLVERWGVFQTSQLPWLLVLFCLLSTKFHYLLWNINYHRSRWHCIWSVSM